MGGAERNARKKKQARRAVNQVTAARSAGGDRNKVIIGIAVVVVLALVVIGGVIWTSRGGDDDRALTPPEGLTGIAAPIAREGAVVVVGQPEARVTIDVYEDFLCPACGNFKKVYGEQIKKEIEEADLRVRYHLLPFLVRYSDPEGYSRDSANAGLCAADTDKFWEYHETLFAEQPEEGGPGYTKQELVQLGRDLGITEDAFAQCVESGAHEAEAQAGLDEIRANEQFKGTPTVMKDGQVVDFGNENWLTDLVS